jgi:hypothetical protein
MDAISNGLDAATTYDLVQAMKLITQIVGLTTVVSLLQVRSVRNALSCNCAHVFFFFMDVPAIAGRVLQFRGPHPDVRGTDHLPRYGVLLYNADTPTWYLSFA